MTNINNLSNNPGNYDKQPLNPCNQISPIANPLNNDPILPYCGDNNDPNLNRVNFPGEGFLDTECDELNGLGHSKNYDPMLAGKLRNDPSNPDRRVNYRYTKALRSCDEAMKNFFSGMEVLDINGRAKTVPIIYATYERAVANLLQGNVRKDNSVVTDRIPLPTLSIHRTGLEFNEKRYVYHGGLSYLRDLRDGKPGFTMSEKFERDTIFGVANGIPLTVSYELNGWCWYVEELDQIEEQIILKTTPMGYIEVKGVPWETILKKTGQADNVETESGEKQRVVKFKFNFAVETYLPQPIVRKKAVLKQTIEFFNTTNENEMTEAIDRLEIAIKDLERELQ
jgi:hypothetical protein